MQKSRTEYVAINTGANFAMQMVSNLMKTILKFVFIRTLGAQYMGASTIFSDVLTMLSLAELGIGSVISFALYKPMKVNDYNRIAGLMDFYKKAYRLVAAFVVVIGLMLLPFLPHIIKSAPDIKENLSLIYVLFIIDSACSYLLIYKSTLFSAGQKRYVISTTSMAFSLARTVVQCVLLLVFKNYILYLVVGILETLIRNLVISRMAERVYPKAFSAEATKLTKNETRSLLKDVYALSLYKVNTVILTSSDSIIMSALLPNGLSSVAYVGMYRTIIHMIDVLINQVYAALLPSVGHMAADATPEKQHSVFKTLLFIAFWCNCFSTTSLFVLCSPFMQLVMGEQFVIAMSVLIALLVDSYMVSMMRTVSTFRNANGLFVQGKYRPVFTSVLDIGFSLLLIKPLGIFGVVVSTSIARLLTTFWFEPMLVYKHVFKQPVWDYAKRYALYVLLTIGCCAVTYYLGMVIDTPYGIVDFIWKMLLCVVIPNGIVILIFRRTIEYKEFIGRIMSLFEKLIGALRRRARA